MAVVIPAGEDAGRPHVLAVNDSRALLAIYAELLAEEGYRVTTRLVAAADLSDVLSLRPDLVVLDLRIGREDGGLTFLERLKGDPATRDLPVLVCSGDSERLDDLAGRLAGWGCAVVRKPFDIDVFLAAAASALRGEMTAPDVSGAERAAD